MNHPLRIIEISIPHASVLGTLKEAAHLPQRLSRAGFNTVYILPWMQIDRSLSSSPYAITNHLKVDVSIGSLQDARSWIENCHKHGLEVVLDMPLNHTSPNHLWTNNLDWYTRDATGNVQPPLGTNWLDVAQLNHECSNLILACQEVLQFWVEMGVDGFRLDAASFIPNEVVRHWVEHTRVEANRHIQFWCDAQANGGTRSYFDAYFDHEAWRLASTNFEEWKVSVAGEERTGILFLTNHDTLHAGKSPLQQWQPRYNEMRVLLESTPRHTMLSWSDWFNPDSCFSFMHR